MEASAIYEHKPPISTEEAVEYTYKVVRHDVASLYPVTAGWHLAPMTSPVTELSRVTVICLNNTIRCCIKDISAIRRLLP